jgi:hypothetical protein
MNKFKQDTEFDDIDNFLTYFENMDTLNDELYDQTKHLNDDVIYGDRLKNIKPK